MMTRYRRNRGFLLIALALPVCMAGCRKTEEPATTTAEPVASPSAADEASDQPLVAEPGTRVLALKVEGMHCDGCAAAIAARVGKVDGVRKVRVSFPARTAWVMVEQTRDPGEAAIVKAIEDLGYKVPARAAATRPAGAPAAVPS